MLFIDSDGVIANFWKHYLDNHNKDFGTNYTVEMMENHLPTKCPYQEYVNEGNWYNNLPEFPWTKILIQKLLNKKEVWAILTSVETTSRTATWEKYQWYKERGIDEKKIIICNDKLSLLREGDIIIDDSWKNIKPKYGSPRLGPHSILVAQPYNECDYPWRWDMGTILNTEWFWK